MIRFPLFTWKYIFYEFSVKRLVSEILASFPHFPVKFSRNRVLLTTQDMGVSRYIGNHSLLLLYLQKLERAYIIIF